jgi:hypothetical protein
MTLPFRRRHHDAESGHDRARQLWSIAMIEPLDDRDSAWLDSHLAGCGECRLERDAQLEDQGLLRSLRDQPIQPPRDLWARTAAAIERESARSRGGLSLPVPALVPARARVPLGVVSGLLVVLVVVAVSFAPNLGTPPTALGTPSGGISNPTTVAVASPIQVAAAPVTYVQAGPDGSVRIIHANVDQVCPTDKSGCAPLQQETQSSLVLGAEPQAIVASPHSDQLVVAAGRDGSHPGSVIVVPVPTPNASGVPTPAASAIATASILPTVPPTVLPTIGPGGSEAPTPVPTPVGAHSIAEGVVLVGEARYSPDGKWLAFSAAPLDGSTGPDLYIWNGADAAATRVTSDHATYFSSWLGDRILASRLVTDLPAPAPGASGTPTSAPTVAPSPAPTALPAGSAAPGASGTGGAIILVEHPISFLFDPATLTTQDLAKPNVWLPTVDPSGRFVTYWDGTLLGGPGIQAPAGEGVVLGDGHLVLDGWIDPIDTTIPNASGVPGASESSAHAEPTATPTETPAEPTATEPTAGSGGPAASPPIGPAGTPIELWPGPITAFDARFDPTGTRLAVWVADATDPTVGTLRLVVLDRGHGRLDSNPSPLPSVKALKGVSIDTGRLAWVSPPGQDGNQSTVQVLAWSDQGEFGQVETVPGAQLTIVR